MTAWVYILRCADGSYYTGLTTALDQRMAQHRAGTFDGYTASRLPLDCVWTGAFQSIHEAIDYERRVKRWTRAKKEALIARDWERLQTLASRAGPAIPKPKSS